MRLESWKYGQSLFCILLVSLIISGCGKKLSEQEYLQNARNHWEQADYRTSMIEVKNVLQINPNNKEARLLLGQIYLMFNQGVAGEKEIRVAAKLGMSKTRTMKPLAKALLLQNKYQEAIEQIDLTQITANTERAELHVIQAQAYFGLKDIDKARQLFKDALKTDSGVKGGYLGLARVATINSQLELAEQYIEKAIKQQPESYAPLLLKGEFYLAQRKFEQAKQLYNKLVIRVKGNSKDRNVSLVSRTGLIRALLAQKEIDEAVLVADQLVKEFPRNPVTNYYRAISAYQKRDFKTSETYFHNVLKVIPDHMPSIYLLGAVSYAQKNYEQATKYLNKFVAAVPSETKAHKMLASTQMQLNQPREAMDVLTQALESNPDDPQILAMLGDAALKEGEHSLGSKYLEKAVSADPNAPEVRTALARAYLSLGKVEQGINELQKSLSQDSQQQQAQLLLVLTYFKQKDYENALSVAKTFQNQKPDDPLIFNLIGGIYAAKGDLVKSREYFENAVKLRPDYQPAIINLARMDLRKGDMKNARKRYEMLLSVDPDNVAVIMGLAQVLDAAGEREEAIKWIKHAHQSNPESITPVLVLGSYHLKKHEYAKALQLLNNSNKRFPDNPQLIFQLGLTNLGLGKFEIAQHNMQRVITLQPRSAKAYYFLAFAHKKKKEPYKSRVSLNKALDIDPTYLAAAQMLVQSEMDEGRSADALNFVRGLQKKYPKSVTGFVLEGDICMQQARFPAAAAAYEKAQSRSKTAEFVSKQSIALVKAKKEEQAITVLNNWLADHPQEISVHTILATTYHQQGKADEAISHYEKILAVQPKHLISLNNLALLYFEKKDKRALELANQAYQVVANAITADTLGWIKLNHGDNKNGLALIEQAAKQAPKSHEIQYHLAVAYARNGQKSEARKILQTILKGETSFDGDDQARALLKSL